MNDWALITGASSGIGLELAHCFAGHRFNVVLVARNEARLKAVAAELRSRHGVETRVLAEDLAVPGAAARIFDALREIPVSALVNNAGFGLFGRFPDVDPGRQTDMIQVNITALVELTHRFVQPMLARRHGRILNVASVAAFLPGPRVNIYYASKAFVYSFSYALADELAGTGVTVTALCPGTTRTAFFERGKFRMADRWPMMEAGEVARIGFRGLMRGKRVVIPGAMNKLAAVFARQMPVRWTAAVAEALHKARRQ